MPLLLPFPPSWRFLPSLSPFPKFLTSPLTGYTSFLGASPFRPIPTPPAPLLGPSSFLPDFPPLPPAPSGLLFPPGFPSPAPDPSYSLLFPFGYQPPAPGSLEGVPIFICDFTRHLVFSEASLMLSFPVRQRFEQGVKNCLTKCALAAPRLLL